MTSPSVSIVGLPSSGKTTFLAALWHLLTEEDIDTALRLKDLHAGNSAYLTSIANRWRQALIQERTQQTGNQNVQINLVDSASDHGLRVNFPDVAGETYRDMWENRTCSNEIIDMLQSKSMLLFVNADSIQQPRWVVDEVDQMQKMGVPIAEGEEVLWTPQLSPTQVQVVELLQLLTEKPFDIGLRNLTLLLSAWDRVASEGLSPYQYLQQRLPLLYQYISTNKQNWTLSVCGLSAQGGVYDDPDKPSSASEEAKHLRELDQPSKRIKLINSVGETEDLTLPFVSLLN